MRNIYLQKQPYTFTTLILVLLSLYACGQTIITDTISGPFCVGASVNVVYNVSGSFNSGNLFTAQLSNANGNFSNPIAIGSVSSTASGIINATTPVNTVSGSGYRIRVVSSSPSVIGNDNGTNITINTLPNNPPAIATLGGTVMVCPGDLKTYYIQNSVAGATGYTWSSSTPGGTILNHRSSTSADSVDVLYDSNLGTYFALFVTADNACGSSASTHAYVYRNNPATPGLISGQVLGVCAGSTGIIYSVPAASGISYNWYFTTATDAVINQNGSNTITIDFGTNWVTGTLAVTASNGTACGNSSARTLAINSIPNNPPAIATLGGTVMVCPGDLKTYYIQNSVAGATGYTWSSSTPGGTILNHRSSASADSVDVLYDSNLGTYFALFVTADNACGSSASTHAYVYRNNPATPGLISGQVLGVCAGSTGIIYSVPAASGISYNWYFTTATDAVINQNGSNTITIDFGTNWVTGTLAVTASNGTACGNSSARTLAINSIPNNPPAIATLGGTVMVCPGDLKTYYIQNSVAGATGYTWSSSTPGGTILNHRSSTSADSVDVLYDSNLGTYFALFVTADNACGSSASTHAYVYRNNPATPGLISGQVLGVCAGSTGIIYSVPAASGISYNWYFTTATDAVINQNGSNTITIDFGTNWVTGTLAVTASNGTACGNSSARTLAINSIPNNPPAIATLGGTVMVCPGDLKTYYIQNSVAGATGYTWSSSTPGGTILNHRSSASADSVDVLYDSNLGTYFALFVTADNACGSSASTHAYVYRNNPATPGLISGQVLGVCAGSTGIIYSVPAASGISYNWYFTTATDAVINQNGSNTITIDFGTNWVTGTLAVTASNGTACGNSSARTLAINSIPNNPPAIATLGGTVMVCPGDLKTYYVQNSVAGATGYTWSSSTPGGTILNHRSSASADSVDVLYDSNLGTYFALFVTADNACGSSASTHAYVYRNNPATPGLISGQVLGVCAGSTGIIYSVPAASGISYNWYFTTATDAVINQNGSNTITIDFGTNWVTGTLAVTASNGTACGNSSARTLAINSIPNNPPAIATLGGTVMVCPGDLKTYYVQNSVAGATGYTWSSSTPGGTILNHRSSTSADSVDVLYDSNLGTYFALFVTADNACGSSASTRAYVYKGTKSVTKDSTCDSYTWLVNGQTYAASGAYAVVGSCHTDSLYLTITKSTKSVTTNSTCDSYTWPVNGQTYASTGAYAQVTGCHTDSLYLTITASSIDVSSASACGSYTWSLNGQTYTSTGAYAVVTGCHTDSLYLNITPSSITTTSISACNSYTWPVNGQTYTSAGAYTVLTGCHIDSLYLNLTPGSITATSISACDSYTWPVNGQTYTSTGAYALVTECHTDSLYLNITPSSINITSASACDSYIWPVNGQTYTSTGAYRMVTGCHIDSLYLSVEPNTKNITIASGCDSYTWSVNGQTYTVSGSYTMVTGCHTEELYLTISKSTSSATTIFNCDSYIWPVNGQTYTTSGIYATVTGCHTDSLYLTITKSTDSVMTVFNCDNYTWPLNRQTYTASGAYAVLTGCHTDSLYLTITESTKSVTTDSTCSSYTWPANGQTYTSAGAYAVVTDCHTDSLYLSIMPITPSTPVAIETLGGDVKVCPGDVKTYYITNVAGASGYTWTSSSLGGTILNQRSGATSDSIDVIYNSNLSATFVLSVTADNSCGSSLPSTFIVNKNTPPTPVSINGPSGACRGQSGVIFSVPSYIGEIYHWTLPANATGSSDSSSISVNFKSTYSGGTISEYASNSCGNSGIISGTIVRYTARPSNPSVVSGTLMNICAGSHQNYSILPVTNATSYIWTAPANASIASGQGTTAISVYFNSVFVSGTFSVQASNCVGSSSNRTFAVSTAPPSAPASIMGGTTVNCGTTLTYSCAASSGAVSYLWTLPVGCNFILSGGGQGTRTIQIVFSPIYSTGVISVEAIGACGGTSALKKITVRSAPIAEPSLITGAINITCNSSNTYSINSVSGVYAYLWTPPALCSINGYGAGVPVTLSAPGGATVTLTAGPGFVRGAIKVAGLNNCGVAGVARSLTIRSLLPAQPSAITGDVNNVCSNSHTYTIVAVTGAAAYQWTPPVGCSINGNGAGLAVTISSPAGASVTLTAPSGFVSGLLTVAAVNTCGEAGAARSLDINGKPSTPANLTPTTVCKDENNLLTVVPSAAGLTYTWTTPYSFTDQGSSSINVNWRNRGGNVTVKASNSCGISTALSKTISVTVCNPTRQEEDQSANNSNYFNIYPNPTSGNLTIEFSSPSTDKYFIRVMDITGRLMINAEGQAQAGTNLHDLNLSSFAKGIYFIVIQKADYMQQMKVVLE